MYVGACSGVFAEGAVVVGGRDHCASPHSLLFATLSVASGAVCVKDPVGRWSPVGEGSRQGAMGLPCMQGLSFLNGCSGNECSAVLKAMRASVSMPDGVGLL
eukprot:6253687-Prorocentrum_lima.AAC.1